MHYRIYDEEAKNFIQETYNESVKQSIKNNMSVYLDTNMSSEEVHEVSKLKWDQYVVRLKSLGFRVEQQPTPFPLVDSTENCWFVGEEDENYSDEFFDDY